MTRVARQTLWACVAVLGGGCECNRTEAACDQTLLALCEYEATCLDGEALDDCVGARPNFTCTVDVEGAETCVVAINDALRAACDGAPHDLPCPLLDQSGLYEPCGGDVVCAADRLCAPIDATTLCTDPCNAAEACPQDGGCNGEVCAPFCNEEFLCPTGQGCNRDAVCASCDAVCVACDDVVVGCACEASSACAADCADRCGGECRAVVDGCDCVSALGCVVCSSDVECPQGSVCDGAFCVVP